VAPLLLLVVVVQQVGWQLAAVVQVWQRRWLLQQRRWLAAVRVGLV
jgi:hypothetical protein